MTRPVEILVDDKVIARACARPKSRRTAPATPPTRIARSDWRAALHSLGIPTAGLTRIESVAGRRLMLDYNHKIDGVTQTIPGTHHIARYRVVVDLV